MNFIHKLNLNYELTNQIFIQKKFSITLLQYFTERGHKFTQIYKLIITTTSNQKNMIYKVCFKQPMQLVELKSNTLSDNNPHLINSQDRCANHPLFRKKYIVILIESIGYPEKTQPIQYKQIFSHLTYQLSYPHT